jgi:hypothetical protein
MQETYLNVPGAGVPLKNVVNKFNEWAGQNGYKPSNSRTLGKLLRSYGYEIELGRSSQRFVMDIAPLAAEGDSG